MMLGETNMNRYIGNKMIKASRFIDYFNSLDNNLKKQIVDRIDELIIEESECCDKGNYKHLCNILSAISIYETLQKNGYSEEKAFETTGSEMYKNIQSSKKRFQYLSQYKLFWPLMKIIVPLGFKLGSGTGWKFTWFKSNNSNEYYFETNQCIYQKIFKKRNLKKLGPMFCHCDIINYGELNNIDFVRKGTLCYEDEVCDFKFVRYPDNNFKRSDSK